MRLKDKSRPKSPLSGFACFVQVIRDKHRSVHSDKHVIFSEFAKKCAERWREMPPDKRAPFEEMSRLDTKRYNREMGDYVQQQQQQYQLTPQHSMGSVHSQQQQSSYDTPSHYHTNMRGGGIKRARRLKDPAMPKRALSAFFFFCDQERPRIRAAHPEWRVSEIAKELGRLWDECTDKAPFERQAQSDKLRYEDEMRQYKAGTFVLNPKRMREAAGMTGSGMNSGGIDISSATAAASANCFEIEGSREVDEMEVQGCDEEDDGDDAEMDEDEEEEEMDEEEEEEDIEGEGFEGEAEVGRSRETTHEKLGTGSDIPKSGINERSQSIAEKGGTEFAKMEEVEESEEETAGADLEGREEEDEPEEPETARLEDEDAKAMSNQVQNHQRQGSNAFSVASVVSGGGVNVGGGDKASEAGAGSQPIGEDNENNEDGS